MGADPQADIATDGLIAEARQVLLAELLHQAVDVAAPAELRDLAEALAALAALR